MLQIKERVCPQQEDPSRGRGEKNEQKGRKETKAYNVKQKFEICEGVYKLHEKAHEPKLCLFFDPGVPFQEDRTPKKGM